MFSDSRVFIMFKGRTRLYSDELAFTVMIRSSDTTIITLVRQLGAVSERHIMT